MAPRKDQPNSLQAQCQVFGAIYNPTGARLGTKVLRQRLRGPALAAYYPRKTATIKDVKKEFGPFLTTWDDAEEDRFEYIEEYVDLMGTSVSIPLIDCV
jgi:hypothetical protein